jgi:dolichol-phosphate mannosyltransferase
MFDERAGAGRCVREVCRVLATLPHRSALIVVDDGSRDGTGETLAALAHDEPRLRVVTHATNRGYGAALCSGVAAAHGAGLEFVLFMDSDLTNAPADIPRFAEQMAPGVDVIKATRYSRGGRAEGVPWWRVAISAAGNRIARRLFRLPVADCTNGFRAVRTALLARMTLREARFAIIMEELWWCRFLADGYREVPVRLTDRTADQRATSFRYRPRVFYDYLKYPVKAALGMRPTGIARPQPASANHEGSRTR